MMSTCAPRHVVKVPIGFAVRCCNVQPYSLGRGVPMDGAPTKCAARLSRHAAKRHASGVQCLAVRKRAYDLTIGKASEPAATARALIVRRTVA